jgi:hypothetical protein
LGGTLGSFRGTLGSPGTSSDDGFSIRGVSWPGGDFVNCRDESGDLVVERRTSAEGRDESAGVDGPGVCCRACARALETPCDRVSVLTEVTVCFDRNDACSTAPSDVGKVSSLCLFPTVTVSGPGVGKPAVISRAPVCASGFSFSSFSRRRREVENACLDRDGRH